MLIPNYLKNNVFLLGKKGKSLTLKFKCDCGNDKFLVFINKVSDIEDKSVKNFENLINTRFNKGNVYQYSDNKGKVFIVRKNMFGKIIDKEDLTNYPIYNSVKAIKLKCNSCGHDHVVFNNRIHGYNAVINNCEIQDEIIFTEYLKKNYDLKNSDVIIKIRNDEDYEEYRKEENVSIEKYSEMFHDITIYCITNNGKKVLILSEETA